jgi:tRNA U34 5-methylaminomethyl-2-thiouridine-forming methyltransferase MnmC
MSYHLIKTEDHSYTVLDHSTQEAYHSQGGANLEALSLYIESSSFKTKLTEKSLAVLDLGLGLGYNALNTIQTWTDHPQAKDLLLVSLENNALLVKDLLEGSAPWTTNWPDSWKQILKIAQKTNFGYLVHLTHPLKKSALIWKILIDNALISIQKLQKESVELDFIWQDAFSPQKCPELWSFEWFKDLRALSIKETELLTYSVARIVKDNLEKTGWDWQKIKTTTKKGHWLKASPKTI